MKKDHAKSWTEFDSQFESIVERNLVSHLVPPIALSIVSIILFCCLFRAEFNIWLSVFSALVAFSHGIAVFLFYRRSYSNSVLLAINFIACLSYLALLSCSFSLNPEIERGRGIALLIMGAALVFAQRKMFLAIAMIAVLTSLVMFQITGLGITGRDVLYVCLIPLIIGYFACNSRENLFLHLNRLFEEKKTDSILLAKALGDAREELSLRKESDGKLAVANQAFDRLINVIPQVHWIRKGKQIAFISPSYKTVWESPCDELCSDPDSFFQYIHPDDLHAVRRSFESNHCGAEVDHEFRLVMVDGRIKWIHARRYVDPDDQVTEFGVAEDITKKKEIEKAVLQKTAQLQASFEELQAETTLRRKIEEENQEIQGKLARSQRLESLSLMAGGIAHDFNNILMAILINVDLLKLDIQQDRAPDLQRIHDIEKSSTRAADICQLMLQFSGRAPRELQKVNLKVQITDAIQILFSTIPKAVVVRFSDLPDQFFTLGMPAQIQQVILNLMTNAIEAVGDAGQIELSLSTGFSDHDQLGATYLDSPKTMTEFHVITCKDNGVGMDDETLQHLFDPFYSCKSKGRGLGLASVIGIVKGHGGTISVESTVGVGTEFRVCFPAYFGESNVLTGDEAARYVSKINVT